MFEMPSTIEFQNMEPKIEVSENKKNIMVTAELPGVNEQDIDLEISTNGYLTISGEKKT
jgi:HSP20 family protein